MINSFFRFSDGSAHLALKNKPCLLKIISIFISISTILLFKINRQTYCENFMSHKVNAKESILDQSNKILLFNISQKYGAKNSYIR